MTKPPFSCQTTTNEHPFTSCCEGRRVGARLGAGGGRQVTGEAATRTPARKARKGLGMGRGARSERRQRAIIGHTKRAVCVVANHCTTMGYVSSEGLRKRAITWRNHLKIQRPKGVGFHKPEAQARETACPSLARRACEKRCHQSPAPNSLPLPSFSRPLTAPLLRSAAIVSFSGENCRRNLPCAPCCASFLWEC